MTIVQHQGVITTHADTPTINSVGTAEILQALHFSNITGSTIQAMEHTLTNAEVQYGFEAALGLVPESSVLSHLLNFQVNGSGSAYGDTIIQQDTLAADAATASYVGIPNGWHYLFGY